MRWWRPWLWWRRRPADGRAAARAQREAKVKLEDARAQWPQVRAQTDRFADAVEAALARRPR